MLSPWWVGTKMPMGEDVVTDGNYVADVLANATESKTYLLCPRLWSKADVTNQYCFKAKV